MSERREISVDFTCDRCAKSRIAARFIQRPADPERVVATPADWYELRRGTGCPGHFCSMACLSAWASVQEGGAP